MNNNILSRTTANVFNNPMNNNMIDKAMFNYKPITCTNNNDASFNNNNVYHNNNNNDAIVDKNKSCDERFDNNISSNQLNIESDLNRTYKMLDSNPRSNLDPALNYSDERVADVNSNESSLKDEYIPDSRVMDDPSNQDQPDPDYIKMFVGQLPQSMDENDLRRMFEEYGRVHQINVLRDKVTGVSKGCCFVTFYTRKAALLAQDALHNIKTLSGKNHPIQMKPADGDNNRKNDRKLFVGMLNKKLNETDVRNMFASYGAIDECAVLRDTTTGCSKGCAFVTFREKSSALAAIKAMHHSQTMEGCSSPLVVKFADTPKEKDQKRLHQLEASLWSQAALTAAAAAAAATNTSGLSTTSLLRPSPPPTAAPVALTYQSAPTILQDPTLGSSSLGPTSLQLLQAFGSTNFLQQQLLNSTNAATCPVSMADTLQSTGSSLFSSSPGPINPINVQNLVTLAALSPSHTINQSNSSLCLSNSLFPGVVSGGNAGICKTNVSERAAACASMISTGSYPSVSVSTALPAPQTLTTAAVPTTLSTALSTFRPDLFAASTTANSALYTGMYSPAASLLSGSYNAGMTAAVVAAGKHVEGPKDCNLFIYHLPQEFNDTDLATTFLPFGPLMSAKVYIDRFTNKTKCFGFVSYNNPLSAQAAIKAMNGFVIGSKRLKVELKRSKNSQPYSRESTHPY